MSSPRQSASVSRVFLAVQENKFLAYGALVGGPQVDDSFEDSRGWCCAAYNEVAIDYNAGFTGAIARLVLYYQDQKLFSDCGLDLGWDHPNATLVSLLWPLLPHLLLHSCICGIESVLEENLQARRSYYSAQGKELLLVISSVCFVFVPVLWSESVFARENRFRTLFIL